MFGYNFESELRSKDSGGGVAVYIQSHLKWKSTVDMEKDGVEGICFEIFPPKRKSFLVFVVYKPPDT